MDVLQLIKSLRLPVELRLVISLLLEELLSLSLLVLENALSSLLITLLHLLRSVPLEVLPIIGLEAKSRLRLQLLLDVGWELVETHGNQLSLAMVILNRDVGTIFIEADNYRVLTVQRLLKILEPINTT